MSAGSDSGKAFAGGGAMISCRLKEGGGSNRTRDGKD